MERESLKIKVYAKINLSLNIQGAKENLHELDTVLTSVDIADVITVYKRNDSLVNVNFAGGQVYKDNSVLKATAALSHFTDGFGADIFIEKNIPERAGLGGSSADAAGVLFALDTLFGLSSRGVDVPAAALKTGSDVPYMLKGGFARVRSTGGAVDFFDSTADFDMVISMGDSGVSTAASYAEFDRLFPLKKFCPTDNNNLIAALKKGNNSSALAELDNALFYGSVRLEPSINATLDALEKHGALKSIMTGSGSACVGFFDGFDKAKLAEKQLIASGLFAKAVKTVRRGIEVI